MGIRDIICQNCGKTLAGFVKNELDETLNINQDMFSYFQTIEVDKYHCLYIFKCYDCGCKTEIIF